jgi:hypothetical protein
MPLFSPASFSSIRSRGAFEEISVAEPKQIAGQVNQASYNQALADELDLDIRNFPKLRAENLRDTKLVRISVRSADVKQARQILSSLFVHLKGELDKRVEVEMKGIDATMAELSAAPLVTPGARPPAAATWRSTALFAQAAHRVGPFR